MIPWKELDRANVPGQEGEVVLLKRGEEFSIRTAGTELMNSRVHASEDALAELACLHIKREGPLKILIGGLGMGYTLAALLLHSEPDTIITVAELIPDVVRWNREYFGDPASMPLDDPRVSVEIGDVAASIGRGSCSLDAILLDVDNGPDGLTRSENDRLYTIQGLTKAFSALRDGGVLAVWSAAPDQAFTRRLNQCGFHTKIVTVRARKSGKGARHTIWLAKKKGKRGER